MLVGGAWRPQPTRTMRIRDPKPRVITVPTFRDRIVHQCLAAAITPRVERRLVAHTFANRVGHDTHAALRRATAWARTWRWHVRLDVKQYFPSIDHDIVRAQLADDVPAALPAKHGSRYVDLLTHL